MTRFGDFLSALSADSNRVAAPADTDARLAEINARLRERAAAGITPVEAGRAKRAESLAQLGLQKPAFGQVPTPVIRNALLARYGPEQAQLQIDAARSGIALDEARTETLEERLGVLRDPLGYIKRAFGLTDTDADEKTAKDIEAGLNGMEAVGNREQAQSLKLEQALQSAVAATGVEMTMADLGSLRNTLGSLGVSAMPVEHQVAAITDVVTRAAMAKAGGTGATSVLPPAPVVPPGAVVPNLPSADVLLGGQTLGQIVGAELRRELASDLSDFKAIGRAAQGFAQSLRSEQSLSLPASQARSRDINMQNALLQQQQLDAMFNPPPQQPAVDSVTGQPIFRQRVSRLHAGIQ